MDILNSLNQINEPIPKPEVIGSIINAALAAADPYAAVNRSLECSQKIVRVGEREYVLSSSSKIVLVGLGKAAPLMMESALIQLGNRVTSGVCVCKHAQEESKSKIVPTIIGNHPVPGEGSLKGGEAIREIVSGLRPEDLVVLLLSGGGSSLANLPAGEIQISEMKHLTDILLRSGATISEINSVRKHLDLLKGGGFLRLASPARVASLVLSDVVGNPLDVIASGPTIGDPTTFEQALEVLNRAEGFGQIPQSIYEYLIRGFHGEVEESLKPSDPLARAAYNKIIGSNVTSCAAAVETAIGFGLNAELITTELSGEAHLAGDQLGRLAALRKKNTRPFLLVCGGETTVKVTGNGIGGRNLEVALAALRKLQGVTGVILVALATDGEDGPTGAAGAVVTSQTLQNAQSMGLIPEDYLARNDSWTFFNKTGNLLVTGPTGTNVNDINFIFGF